MKDCISILLSLFFLLQQSTMQTVVNTAKPASGGTVTLDATAHATPSASSPLTWNHTVTGSNTALFVMLSSDTSTITCTFNSISMGTAIWTQADGANEERTVAFALPAPASGTHAVSCVFVGGTVRSGASISFNGANQTTPNRSCYTAKDGGGGSTTASVTVANAVSGDFVIDNEADYHSGSGAGSVTSITGNQTLTYSVINAAGGQLDQGTQRVAATGSTLMSWTLAPNPSYWAIGACAVRP